ncbi:MAG: response regulator transcription factor [Candidatus Dormibacteraeota bacterium]|nr:response regulator transcription factor [Candidatus Dormibacteraeota bacterium]
MSGSRGVVLIVEDDEATSELISELVEQEGFTVARVSGGLAALEAFTRDQPIAVFLDWVLPDVAGIEACRSLRALDRSVPIIFVSGREDEASTIRGLDAGADDFVIKPIRIRELIARLEAHLRKVVDLAGVRHADAPAEKRVYKFGDIELDLAARLVWAGGQALNLAPLEFSLLEYLAANTGVAVSRDQIMKEVYGFAADISTERVDQLVRRLRTKLGDGPRRGGILVAVPGFGYRLEQGPAQTV